METRDIAVIGGGPAGLSTAISASRFGVETILFEEHENIGLPWHCAGIASSSRLKSLHIEGFDKAVLAEFDTVDIYLSLRHAFTVISDVPQLILDRISFDNLLAEKASSSGVELKLRSKVKALRYTYDNLVEVYTDSARYKCRVVVLAEGLPGVLARNLGFDTKSLSMLPSIQYLARVDPPLTIGIVEVHLLPGLSPPFFVWVIPIDTDLCRVGLASHNPRKLKPLLESFLSKRFKNWYILSESRWVISVGGPLRSTVKKRIILVGDVAGQTKPTTGGGIVSSIVCGTIAGRISGLASTRNDYTLLDMYEALWRKFLGFNFKIQKIARKAVDRMHWRTLSSIVESISREYQELRVVDLDTQIDLILKLISSPDLASKIVGSLLKPRTYR
ncbi:MAG: NAD(P)/FAD-dependent oxidoreductase [Candidatus Bathyarchaeota archaeon]|nr:NAD(P)/FAD-dependent oxidoreductase [Candidatus Bathyarchaeota archaeon]